MNGRSRKRTKEKLWTAGILAIKVLLDIDNNSLSPHTNYKVWRLGQLCDKSERDTKVYELSFEKTEKLNRLNKNLESG